MYFLPSPLSTDFYQSSSVSSPVSVALPERQSILVLGPDGSLAGTPLDPEPSHVPAAQVTLLKDNLDNNIKEERSLEPKLTADFETVYPSANITFMERFPLVKLKLLKLLADHAESSRSDQTTIELLELASVGEEQANLAALLGIVTLLRQMHTITVPKKKLWRLSREETRSGFLARVASASEIVTYCIQREALNVSKGAVGGMLGARLKSWMEAQLGRAKKRKQKQARPAPATAGPPPHLSSPESAYSTGYSTDGTSPGAAPAPLAAPLVAPPPPPTPPTTHLYHEPAKRRSSVGIKRCPLPEPPVCMTPSPRPRCRIRTNPWLGSSPDPRRRPPLPHQQSLQCAPHPPLAHAPYSLDSYPARYNRSPHLSPRISPQRSPFHRGGASSDEECRAVRARGRETAILSDADFDTDGDTGLDGGDEDEPDDTASPGRRRARRRRPPRRPPRSAGATPPRARRRHAPSAPPVRERDPLLEADREAERKYRELIREAEKLLVTVSRAPLEPPHNPRVRELRATEVEAPRRSPERTHLTNFMRANSPEPPRRPSPAARRSPLAAPPPAPRALPPSERPHSEPPKRKAYARDEVLQTLEGLRKSLQQQSALLAVQRTRLDSL